MWKDPHPDSTQGSLLRARLRSLADHVATSVADVDLSALQAEIDAVEVDVAALEAALDDYLLETVVPEVIVVVCSDETTAITTGTAKVTFRMPYTMTLTEVRASLTASSSSGNPTFDINENGTSCLSTKLSIDSGEETSTTAATSAVISDATLTADSEITIDFDTAGTGAKGVKVYLIGTRSV